MGIEGEQFSAKVKIFEYLLIFVISTTKLEGLLKKFLS